jgi:hypothetical protein
MANISTEKALESTGRHSFSTLVSTLVLNARPLPCNGSILTSEHIAAINRVLVLASAEAVD